MAKVDEAVIARFSKGEHTFEILVDPLKAQSFLDGKAKLDEVLAVSEVFKDVGSAERASEDNLKKVFGTTDFLKIADHIVRHGEIQLTTDQKRKMTEEKRNRIIEYIVRNAIDPKTGLPHPRTRIENALTQVRVNIVYTKPVEEQVDEIVKALRPLIPIKFEKVKMAIKFPSQYAPSSYSYAKSLSILNEEWLNDGSLAVVVEIPGGIQNDVIDAVNKLTKGSGQVKLMK